MPDPIYLFWMLIRVPAVNTIFSVTTLTHYFKRFHEPETRLKDLVKVKNNKKQETPYNNANSADAKGRTAD